MDNYSSVSSKLLSHFEKDLDDLPDELKPLVQKVFALIPWNNMPIKRRRERAAQWDFDHDPVCNKALERMFNLQAKIDEEQNRLVATVIPRWKLPADYFDKLGYQGLLAAIGARVASESAVARGQKSGEKRSKIANEWREPALKLALDIRSKDSFISQSGLAKAIMEQWPQACPGIPLPVDVSSLIKFIRDKEREALLPRRQPMKSSGRQS